jgi:hypothetical protein
MRWSKHPWVYIKNFYLAEQAYERKTESGGHTRGPQGNTARPRGVASCCLVTSSWVLSAVSYFCIFSNIPKQTEIIFMEFLELVYLPYHIPTPFQGSRAFRKDFDVFLRCHCLNNISFNINGGTWDIMLNSLSIHHSRVGAFGVVDFSGSGSVNFFDDIRPLPFREKLSCKKS